ncbi:hypothetical protein chiPu_0012559 [Chiloscyllium punctatum]|uniref:Uncharacterized protein n=1 Tax=Chiloscyllium punctatum TaxID=137246 RepID=A0A401SUQ3_CHIPU|nr:hypothetical protein [Chiloscyllium punctatum]
MAEGRRIWDKEDDLPVYLARPGTSAQIPRQKYGGMFCSVEGAYESKTLDFDALSVGRRSSRSASGASKSQGSRDNAETPGDAVRESPQATERGPGVQIITSNDKERLQNQSDPQPDGEIFVNNSLVSWINIQSRPVGVPFNRTVAGHSRREVSS